MTMISSTPTTTPKRRGRPPKTQTPASAVQRGCSIRLDERTQKAVERATRLLESCAEYRTEAMNTPESLRTYLKLKLSALEHEEFHAVWLDAQNRIIAFERLFGGSLTQTSVYPREVVKAALKHNAAAVVFAHNHPSGIAEPSSADMHLTGELKRTLALIDVRVHDHFIVAGTSRPLSFAERGLL